MLAYLAYTTTYLKPIFPMSTLVQPCVWQQAMITNYKEEKMCRQYGS